MKLIHCADLHLDARMQTHLPPDRAAERRKEILQTFVDLVRLASGSVDGILIAGDLFDGEAVTVRTTRTVLEQIRSHPELTFFYLPGNHDAGSRFSRMENKPGNLVTFDREWKPVRFGNPGDEVVIWGSTAPDPDTLHPEPGECNLLLFHGELTENRRRDPGEEQMPKDAFRGKNLDYIAMGHYHSFLFSRLDERCTACYAGCLEGRGFDEIGKKGYVLLEIAGGRVNFRFVEFARRTVHATVCEMEGDESPTRLADKVMESVAQIPSGDMVKLILKGFFNPETKPDLPYLEKRLNERFYFARVEDQTHLLIRPEDYVNDISLKGEFVRRVMASELSDEEKEKVILLGFRALLGEEVLL